MLTLSTCIPQPGLEGAGGAGKVKPRRRLGSLCLGSKQPLDSIGSPHTACHSPTGTQVCAPSSLRGKTAAPLKANALFQTYLNSLRSPATGIPRPREAGLSLSLKILFKMP